MPLDNNKKMIILFGNFTCFVIQLIYYKFSSCVAYEVLKNLTDSRKSSLSINKYISLKFTFLDCLKMFVILSFCEYEVIKY